MIDAQDTTIRMLRVLTKVFGKLTPEQAEQVLGGEGELVFLPPGAKIALPALTGVEARARMAAAGSRQGAIDYLVSLKLTKAETASLAKQLGIAVTSKDSVASIRESIVDGTVGAQAETEGIRSRAWAK